MTENQNSYEYVAHYDAVGASNAERKFYIKSIRELRLWRTVVPPIFFLFSVAIGYIRGFPNWFLVFFLIMFLLSIAGPLFFLIARPRSAAALAQKYPCKRVCLRADSVVIRVADKDAEIKWDKVRHVWDLGDYIALVMSPFAAIQLPKQGMPEGGLRLIQDIQGLR